MYSSAVPLVPRKSNSELLVVAIGRISTAHQDAENIEASYRYIRDVLDRMYNGPIRVIHLGEQASGMRTDRTTIREAERLVAGGTVDLVIAEDLARIYRNPRYQYDFVQNAVDMGTRVICVGDNLDTADENWEITMGAAALRHGLYIPDTRRRVRRTATHAFHKGGMVQKVRYGYRKLTVEEAASGQFGPTGLRIAKVIDCTPIIQEMRDRLLRGQSYLAIGGWLNAAGIGPGPYVTSGRWSGRLVVELLADPILCGTRTFRDTVCRPVYRTGRHKPTRNSEPEQKHYPELAHISPDEHEVVLSEIERRRAEHALPQPRPMCNRPRSRSLWPGQAITCGICGGLMHYRGYHLRCCNSTARSGYRCWNRVQVPTQITRELAIKALFTCADSDEKLWSALVETLWQLTDTQNQGRRYQSMRLHHEVAALEKQAATITTAIGIGGDLQSLVVKLREVEDALAKTRWQIQKHHEAENRRQREVVIREIQENPQQAILRLIEHSYECADELRRLMPSFSVVPVQALDTPIVRPRAKIRFDFSMLADKSKIEFHSPSVEVIVDLFSPPKHIAALEDCQRAKVQDPCRSLKSLAKELHLNHMTVKRALDYTRRMHSAGLTEPYRELTRKPNQASRWKARQLPSKRS